jgi:hypothetical protein
MARREWSGHDRPVSDAEIAAMPKEIDGAFDDLYERLADELGGEPEDYRTDPDEFDAWAED